MSLSIALQNALSGLQTNEAMIQIISNNVTNANTEGYTRKTIDPVAVTVDGQGRGVEAGELMRVVDERLLVDLRATLGELGDARTQDFYLGRILDQFGTLANDSSLGATITDLATTLQGLAASPDSSGLRTEAVSMALALAKQLNDMSDRIQSLRFDADREIATKVGIINAELEKIASLNAKIEGGHALGESTDELEDLRDQALNTLSEFIDVRYFRRTSGEIVVTLPDGHVLADKVAFPLSHTPAGALSPDISYPNAGIGDITSGSGDITTSIQTGELRGLIQARDTILPNIQAQIDQLSQVLRDELNALHNTGTSRPPPNTLTGTRSFSVPAANTITISSAVRIGVVDQSGNFVSHYDLPAGTYSITQIESMIDTNLSGFATASTSTNGPLSITASGATNGIAIVDLGPQTVTHTDGTTTFNGFSNYFGLNDMFVTPGRVQGDSTTGLASMIQLRSDIASDPSRLARGTLSTAATPAQGAIAISLGDASVAQALADKFIEDLPFAAAGALPPASTTLASYGSEILSAVAVSSSTAQRTAEFKTTLFEELSFRNSSVSGVNVDEELRNMVLLENAYAATARVIQVVDDLLELLVNLGR